MRLQRRTDSVNDFPVSVQWPERLSVRLLSTDDAKAIAEWRYDGPWQVYDHRAVDDLPVAGDGYRTVVSALDGAPVGFYCVGPAARVPGVAEDNSVLDVGVGMCPQWVGRGHGAAFGGVVLADIRRADPGIPLRAVVQSWNIRSLLLSRRLGFVPIGSHRCIQNGRAVEYTILVQTAKTLAPNPR
jgi:[ribosomal protein S18]-alanine N-acetyltransferase